MAPDDRSRRARTPGLLAFVTCVMAVPASAKTWECSANAAFAVGSVEAVVLGYDHRSPQDWSIEYAPKAAGLEHVSVSLHYPTEFLTDRLVQPSGVQVVMDTTDSSPIPFFVLDVGGTESRFGPPVSLYSRKTIEYRSGIRTNRSLLDAITNGGEGRLLIYDQKGRLLNTLALTFGEASQVQNAAIQAERAARGFAAAASQSDYCARTR